MQLGTVLRKMRRGAGMSQEDMALELHMSISNVSRLETGKYELKAIDLINWANATGAQDVLVAMLLSVDIAIVQQILEASTTVVGSIIGSILGGIL